MGIALYTSLKETINSLPSRLKRRMIKWTKMIQINWLPSLKMLKSKLYGENRIRRKSGEE